MGLIRFAIYFILGNLFLTMVEKHSLVMGKGNLFSWTSLR